MLTRYLRHHVYWIILTALLAMIILYQDAHPRVKTVLSPRYAAYPMDERILTKHVKVDFNGTSLTKVLYQWAAESAIKISTNWSTLEADNISRDAPVTLKVDGDMAFEDALDLLARYFQDIDYDIHDGVVYISTRGDISTRTITIFYDVGPLIIPETISEGSVDNRVAALCSIITTNVEPGQWKDAGTGGYIGSITRLDQRLAIRATYRMHRKIAHVLEILRHSDLNNELASMFKR